MPSQALVQLALFHAEQAPVFDDSRDRIRHYNVFENLKLPLCPKCGDTEHVFEMENLTILLVVRERFPWFECRRCNVRWNARDGVRERHDPQYDHCEI